MSKKPEVSDEEFIALWEQHNSPLKIAQIIGISERHAHTRRRKIEARLKVELSIGGIKHHVEKARHKAGLTDGIALVFSDAHFWPGIRSTAFKGLLWAISTLKPHVVVANGDIFDGASISRFPRIGWTHRPNVKQELDACQEAMKEIEELVTRQDTILSWYGLWGTTIAVLRHAWLRLPQSLRTCRVQLSRITFQNGIRVGLVGCRTRLLLSIGTKVGFMQHTTIPLDQGRAS